MEEGREGEEKYREILSLYCARFADGERKLIFYK
jgi:hypothetical protein